MSVSRRGEDETETELTLEELESFNDHVVETFQYGGTWKTENMGPSDQVDWAVGRPKVAGGLDRGEVAELVAIEKNYMTVYPTDPQEDSSSGAAIIESQFGFEPQDASADMFDTATSPGGSTFDKDADDDGNPEAVDIFAGSSVPGGTDDQRHRLMWREEAFLRKQKYDSADASTITGEINPYTGEFGFINYRNEFGRGPLLFDDDVYVASGDANLKSWAGSDIQLNANFTLYWDVFEAQDEQRYNDIRFK